MGKEPVEIEIKKRQGKSLPLFAITGFSNGRNYGILLR